MRLYLKFVHILIKSVEFRDEEKKRKNIFLVEIDKKEKKV